LIILHFNGLRTGGHLSWKPASIVHPL
jgi:hypothetical protein